MDCHGLAGWHQEMGAKSLLDGDEEAARFHRLASKMVFFLAPNERLAMTAAADISVKRRMLDVMDDLSKKVVAELRDFKQMSFGADDGTTRVVDATVDQWKVISGAIEECVKCRFMELGDDVSNEPSALVLICKEWMQANKRRESNLSKRRK